MCYRLGFDVVCFESLFCCFLLFLLPPFVHPIISVYIRLSVGLPYLYYVFLSSGEGVERGEGGLAF